MDFPCSQIHENPRWFRGYSSCYYPCFFRRRATLYGMNYIHPDTAPLDLFVIACVSPSKLSPLCSSSWDVRGTTCLFSGGWVMCNRRRTDLVFLRNPCGVRIPEVAIHRFVKKNLTRFGKVQALISRLDEPYPFWITRTSHMGSPYEASLFSECRFE